jgi:hypothetical protein
MNSPLELKDVLKGDVYVPDATLESGVAGARTD